MEAGRAGPHSCVQVAAPFPRWWWAEMPMLGVVRTVPQGPTHTQPSPACRHEPSRSSPWVPALLRAS